MKRGIIIFFIALIFLIQGVLAGECAFLGKQVECPPEFIFFSILVIVGLISIFGILFSIAMIIDALKYEKRNKVLWILIIVLTFNYLIGALLYYFLIKRKRSGNLEKRQNNIKDGDFKRSNFLPRFVYVIYTLLFISLAFWLLYGSWKEIYSFSHQSLFSFILSWTSLWILIPLLLIILYLLITFDIIKRNNFTDLSVIVGFILGFVIFISLKLINYSGIGNTGLALLIGPLLFLILIIMVLSITILIIIALIKNRNYKAIIFIILILIVSQGIHFGLPYTPMYDNYLYEEALGNGEYGREEACKKIMNKEKREECFIIAIDDSDRSEEMKNYARAIYLRSDSYCKLIETEGRDDCYVQFMLEHGEFTSEEISCESLSEHREECFDFENYHLALKSKSKSYCDNISRESLKERCYRFREIY